jgi:tetratricopeptide (TPR) repeat protein
MKSSLVIVIVCVCFLAAILIGCDSDAERSLDKAAEYIEQGDTFGAVKALAETIGNEPRDADFFVRRADLYSELQVTDHAVSDYEKAISIEPSAEAYTGLASIVYSPRNLRKSIELLDEAIKIDPSYAPAYGQRARFYYLLFHQGNVLPYPNEVSDLQSQFYYKFVYQEYALPILNEVSDLLSQALEDISKAIELEPGQQYRDIRAVIYIDLERFEDAIEDYTECIRQMPYPSYYTDRSYVYNLAGLPQRARVDLTIAINIDPTYLRAFRQRGMTHMVLEDYERALDDFNSSIEASEAQLVRPDIYLLRAACHLMQGNSKQAIDDYERAVRSNPDVYDIKFYTDMVNEGPAVYGFVYSRIVNALQILENLP